MFISYSHTNRDFVDRLYEELRLRGVSVWLDRHDFVAGSLERNITRAVRLNDIVVLVLSETALQSKWVWDEINLTMEKEQRENRDVLCPVRIDDSCFSDPRNKRRLMVDLRERNILDFADWQSPDAFASQFEKLFAGMKINFR